MGRICDESWRPGARVFDNARCVWRASPMLVEIRNVKQEPGHFRRWFESDELELVIWQQTSEAEVDGFQLIYRNASQERALTWRKAGGFAHARVHTGDTHPFKNSTPVLMTSDEPVPWQRLSAWFEQDSAQMEAHLREFVAARLAERK